MALLAAAFAFAHSKWNGEAGPERVVFKAREHLTAGSAEDNDWSLFMFNGEKVQNLKLAETSDAFSEELEEESEFHSTLYHMLKASASSEAMDKVERTAFRFIDSVYQLLLATRVLAYSKYCMLSFTTLLSKAFSKVTFQVLNPFIFKTLKQVLECKHIIFVRAK
uniref:protein CASC1-like n=1 Tax=Lonchura striata TaxID=40157 RepID=UPI000B4C7D51|nr:protein CASC1-like [Lonchura striata domestica]